MKATRYHVNIEHRASNACSESYAHIKNHF